MGLVGEGLHAAGVEQVGDAAGNLVVVEVDGVAGLVVDHGEAVVVGEVEFIVPPAVEEKAREVRVGVEDLAGGFELELSPGKR